nr:putative serine/threonine-protein kinase pbl4 [Quercus suber]
MASPPGFASANHKDIQQEMDAVVTQKTNGWSFRKLGNLLSRRHANDDFDASLPALPSLHGESQESTLRRRSSVPQVKRRPAPIASLPRPQTFRRQESERRERLQEVLQSPNERRESSVEFRRRTRGSSASAVRRPISPKPLFPPTTSASEATSSDQSEPQRNAEQTNSESQIQRRRALPALTPLRIPTFDDEDDDGAIEVAREEDDGEIGQTSLTEEHDQRWILNLSMHFRDKSNREKFFVTYAESRSQWRRLTISLDYRTAPEGSLEADLNTLHYQRDKSLRIFEAIRDSLSDIQYYSTVTNLKLSTTPEDGQLHVHVREDANEVIQYPSTSLFGHVECPLYKECELEFHSHISGFVYKVNVGGDMCIKKEIPGPDTVDEFLYEVNALYSLLGCDNVVQLKGLVTDDAGSVVKALLISYAPQGALVDMIYDFRGTRELPWYRREKWAKQAVRGLANIHEAGFVQGDFTLSNIVIDTQDDAQIIDINRRGCPVGWEPPELGKLINSGQRIGMCIGVKTDLFQLGMVLWALAEEEDEPEREDRPLRAVSDRVPGYYRKIIEICLSEKPQGRSSAQRLLQYFPACAGMPPLWKRAVDEDSLNHRHSGSSMDNSTSTSHRSDKEYIDPRMAITLDEVRTRREQLDHTEVLSGVAYLEPDSNAASTTYPFGSSGSWLDGQPRGRSPVSSMQRRSSPYSRSVSSTTSLSESSHKYPNFDLDKVRTTCWNESKVDGFEVRSAEAVSTLHRTSMGGAFDDSERIEPHFPDLPRLMDQRLSLLQDQLVPRSLQHVDSGFDEHMIQELNTAPSAGPELNRSNEPAQKYVSSAETQTPLCISPTASASATLRTMAKTYVITDDNDDDSKIS